MLVLVIHDSDRVHDVLLAEDYKNLGRALFDHKFGKDVKRRHKEYLEEDGEKVRIYAVHSEDTLEKMDFILDSGEYVLSYTEFLDFGIDNLHHDGDSEVGYTLFIRDINYW